MMAQACLTDRSYRLGRLAVTGFLLMANSQYRDRLPIDAI